ncbi:MAG: hypothetical protein HY237_05660 [Acidobacteria bacterium]|nr:hypothetical protein [Acidobacteriota bacterium]
MQFRGAFLRLQVALVATVLVGLSVAAQLPPSKGAPKVGEEAPDFTLPIASGSQNPEEKTLTLSRLVPNKTGQWILLVFYRGYW